MDLSSRANHLPPQDLEVLTTKWRGLVQAGTISCLPIHSQTYLTWGSRWIDLESIFDNRVNVCYATLSGIELKWGQFDFLVFILTSVLNGHKLGRNFGSAVILDFIPSHGSILEILYGLRSTVMKELKLGVHSLTVVIVQSTGIYLVFLVLVGSGPNIGVCAWFIR